MNSQKKESKDIIFVSGPRQALKEIQEIISQFLDPSDANFFANIYEDVSLMFEGRTPGYRASNTQYHDFEHTASVVLAAARLIHGCVVDGQNFLSKEMLLTLIAALFHDVGLIQEEDDLEGSGAKYTVGHEERSVLFLRKYLSEKEFTEKEIETCSNFIRCTILSFSPAQIPFPSKKVRYLGYIVGSADLLAQMADRHYLEKLLLLYKEFEEASLPGFQSEQELLKKTKDFYEIIAKKRLSEELDNVSRHMRSHLKNWLDTDKDLYDESIQRNINYLESVVALCDDAFTCYLDNLRRGGISQEIIESLDKNEKE